MLTFFLGEYVNARKVISRCKTLNVPLNNVEKYFGLILFALFDLYDDRNPSIITYDAQTLVLTPIPNFSTIENVLVHQFADWEDKEKLKAKKGLPFIPEPAMFWRSLLELMEKLYVLGYLQ